MRSTDERLKDVECGLREVKRDVTRIEMRVDHTEKDVRELKHEVGTIQHGLDVVQTDMKFMQQKIQERPSILYYASICLFMLFIFSTLLRQ